MLGRIARLGTGLALLAVWAAAPARAGQSSITLRPSARLATAEGGIRLRDVADVSGDDAERLGGAVIVPDAAALPSVRPGWSGVDLAQVRAGLDSALGPAGVNWGRITLHGSTCAVAIGEPPAPSVPRVRPERPVPAAVAAAGPATARTAVATRLAQLYGVGMDDLRLAFPRGDEAFLASSVAGLRTDVQPIGTVSSPRIAVRVFVYDGERMVASVAVTPEVLIRRGLPTAAATIERKQPITAEALTMTERWMPPGGRPAATAEGLVGLLAKSRIAAGQAVTVDLVETPILIKKGQEVRVHCLSGLVTIKTTAKALSDGRDGDRVQLRLPGATAAFWGRVSGPGQAVSDAGGAAQD